MARQQDKTERATPQRRRKAREEGTVAKSQEVAVATSLLAGALTLRIAGPAGADVLRRETTRMLATASADRLPTAELVSSATRIGAALLGPLLLAAVVAALAAGIAQVGLKPTPKAAQPKMSNLSPKRGLKRLKPATAGWELVRTGVKLGLLLAIVWGPLQDGTEQLARERGLGNGLSALLSITWSIFLRAALLAAVVAAADYAWNRWRTEKELRMSKEDVRREHKDNEGDPLLRAQRRRRQSELSRNRMLRDVATADVVVTNPTHLAVALSYRDGDAAPRVVAKGADRVAATIRSIAHRNGVPVTEDKPLARALYRRCRIGQYVPAALYEAVAVVLAFAFRRRGTVLGKVA